MYVPTAFELSDANDVAAILADFSFALVVTRPVSGELFMDHVPLLHDPEEGVLYGHFAGCNPHAGAIVDAPSVTAIFMGPHAYVSPQWHTTEGLVPTWNYVAVHVHGVAKPVSDSEGLRALERKVEKYEASQESPWDIADLGQDRVRTLQRAIVSFKIVPRRIEAKAKLSQTRSDEDRARVIAALEAGGTEGGQAVARLMRAGATDNGRA
jgi:transcriptional regulator